MRQIAIGKANDDFLQRRRRNSKYAIQISSVTIDGNELTWLIAIKKANDELLQRRRRDSKYAGQNSSVTIDGNELTC